MSRLLALVLAALLTQPVFAKVNLKNAFLLSPGMSKKEVVETMGGRPVTAEFIGELEEWHYCTTGFSTDKFAAVYFIKGELYAMKEYRNPGINGSCQKGLKGGTYSEPDIVKEYRIKYQ